MSQSFSPVRMEVVRVFIAVSSAFLVLSVLGEDMTGLSPCDFPAIYNFGDSNSDTGGISAAFYPAGQPSGETFFHQPVGRASDGRLIIDFIGILHFNLFSALQACIQNGCFSKFHRKFISLLCFYAAESLRLPYLSAYLNSIGTSFRYGANFATGGSTIRRLNESFFANGVSPFSLDIQIAQFDQFKTRTSNLYNQSNMKHQLLKENSPL